MLEVKFVSEFNGRYQRNNKRTGQKNLRCFPQCSENGHMASGFCGLPIVCEVKGVDQSKGNVKLISFGEFCAANAPEKFKWHQEYETSELSKSERCRTNPTLPYLKGDVEKGENGCYKISFNTQLLGWHYHWVSTKHTCDSFHSFRIYVFMQDHLESKGPSNKLKYLGSGNSPRFQIYSRRRQRGVNKPDEIIKQTSERRSDMQSASTAKRQKQETNMFNPISNSNGNIYGDTHNAAIQSLSQLSALLMQQQEALMQASGRETLYFQRLKPENAVLGSKNVFPSMLPSLAENTSTPLLELIKAGHLNPIDVKKHALTSGRLMIFLWRYSQENALASAQKHESTDDALEEFSLNILQDLLGTGLQESFQAIASNGRAENSSIQGDNQKGHEYLKECLQKQGKAELVKKVDSAIETMSKLGEFLVEESELSNELNELFAELATQGGIEKLAQEMKEEVNFLMRAPLDRDLDTEIHVNIIRAVLTNQVPKSSFERVRYIIIKHMMRFLIARRARFRDIEDILDAAAHHRILPLDPEVAPNEAGLSYMRLQLSGLPEYQKQLDEAEFLSAKGEFKAQSQRELWRRAFLMLKRKQVRYGIIQRVRQEHKSRRAKQASITQRLNSPVHPSIDLNGSWSRAEFTGNSFLLDIIKRVSGTEFGSLPQKLIGSMFSQIHLTASMQTLHIQGERKILANACMQIHLDGSPRKIEFTLPFPFPSRIGVERKYSAWIHLENGLSELRVVGASLNKAKLVKDMKATKANKSKVTTLAGISNAIEFLADNGNQEQVFVTVRARLNADRSRLEVIACCFVYDMHDPSMPNLSSRVSLEQLFTDEESVESAPGFFQKHTFTYYKIFDDSSSVEDLLKLIE